jgi:hypothetical protein
MYEAAFRQNDIDEMVLPSLTHENLKELGVASLGHRVKLLDDHGDLPTLGAVFGKNAPSPSCGPRRALSLPRLTQRPRRVLGLGELDGPCGAHGP